MKTFSVVDRLAHGATSVMVYVCAMRINEAIFSQENKNHSHHGGGIDGLLVTARSLCAESVVTIMIIAAGWWDCMLRNLLMFIYNYSR